MALIIICATLEKSKAKWKMVKEMHGAVLLGDTIDTIRKEKKMSNIVDECNSISNQSDLPLLHSIVASSTCYHLHCYWIVAVLRFSLFHFERNAKRNEPMTKEKMQRITTNINKVQNGKEIHSKLNFNAKGGFTTLSQYFLVNAIVEWHSEIKFSLLHTNSCITHTHT